MGAQVGWTIFLDNNANVLKEVAMAAVASLMFWDLEVYTMPYGSNHLVRWWLGCIIRSSGRYFGSITILSFGEPGSLGMIKSWNFLLPNFCLGSFLTWICPDFQEEQREKVLQEAEQAVRRCPPWNVQFATGNGWLEDYFPFGMAYFEGQTASFRECNCVECVFWETSLCVVCQCAYKLSQSAQNGNWNIHLF